LAASKEKSNFPWRSNHARYFKCIPTADGMDLISLGRLAGQTQTYDAGTLVRRYDFQQSVDLFMQAGDPFHSCLYAYAISVLRNDPDKKPP